MSSSSSIPNASLLEILSLKPMGDWVLEEVSPPSASNPSNPVEGTVYRSFGQRCLKNPSKNPLIAGLLASETEAIKSISQIKNSIQRNEQQAAIYLQSCCKVMEFMKNFFPELYKMPLAKHLQCLDQALKDGVSSNMEWRGPHYKGTEESYAYAIYLACKHEDLPMLQLLLRPIAAGQIDKGEVGGSDLFLESLRKAIEKRNVSIVKELIDTGFIEESVPCMLFSEYLTKRMKLEEDDFRIMEILSEAVDLTQDSELSENLESLHWISDAGTGWSEENVKRLFSMFEKSPGFSALADEIFSKQFKGRSLNNLNNLSNLDLKVFFDFFWQSKKVSEEWRFKAFIELYKHRCSEYSEQRPSVIEFVLADGSTLQITSCSDDGTVGFEKLSQIATVDSFEFDKYFSGLEEIVREKGWVRSSGSYSQKNFFQILDRCETLPLSNRMASLCRALEVGSLKDVPPSQLFDILHPEEVSLSRFSDIPYPDLKQREFREIRGAQQDPDLLSYIGWNLLRGPNNRFIEDKLKDLKEEFSRLLNSNGSFSDLLSSAEGSVVEMEASNEWAQYVAWEVLKLMEMSVFSTENLTFAQLEEGLAEKAREDFSIPKKRENQTPF